MNSTWSLPSRSHSPIEETFCEAITVQHIIPIDPGVYKHCDHMEIEYNSSGSGQGRLKIVPTHGV